MKKFNFNKYVKFFVCHKVESTCKSQSSLMHVHDLTIYDKDSERQISGVTTAGPNSVEELIID
jgi:hypothetical protein